MSRTPADVPDELFDRLRQHLDDGPGPTRDLTGGQPGNEPAFMPAYEAARSRVGTQSAPV
jgi:hypothetical protein